LTGKGPYGAYILKCCARDEIRGLGNFIVPERGNLFNFVGVKTLSGQFPRTEKAYRRQIVPP